MDLQHLRANDATVAGLSRLLIETVAGGGSVSFMHPLEPQAAEDFWRGSFGEVAAGRRIILGALDDGELIGTVTLDLVGWPNQPHRAEIGKLMTRADRRGQGVATALMTAAHETARAAGRTLIVLDTAEEGGAAGLYSRLGYQLTGLIPDFALKPHGGLTGTLIMWKVLEPA